jgi:hypothetical protein
MQKNIFIDAFRMTLPKVAILLFLSLPREAHSQNSNWEQFLSKNDRIYDTLTTEWGKGIFTGNGLLGNMITMADSGSMKMEIGRTDVYDHRHDKGVNHLYTSARLPIGHFILTPVGTIIGNTARLRLWNAEATGILTTTAGKIYWRSLSLAKENTIIFQTRTEGKESHFSWSWVQERSVSTRTRFKPMTDFPDNPRNSTAFKNGIQYSIQPMLAGGDYVTAWKSDTNSNTSTTYITVAYDSCHTALPKAVSTITKAAGEDLAAAFRFHRQWWHAYYQKSFLSVPDPMIESFYWIQLYKLASATRSNTLPIDLMGPWFADTPWPAYWFNLNIELTYSPLYKANHTELVKPLIHLINRNFNNLVNNTPSQYRYNAAAVGRSAGLNMIYPLKVYSQLDTAALPPELELGDLTWILYYYWQYFNYTSDSSILKQLIPILSRSINYDLDVMHKESDGKWHLPETYSPEYPNGITRDCNYALSLFRWGCETLLKLSPDNKLAKKWKDVLQHLVDYPTDETGLRIGRDAPFSISHRHYSHLLMIYPLHLLSWDKAGDRALIDKSLHHWQHLTGALKGYSFSGAASMFALMGKGDSALNCLKILLTKYIKPNTMYVESGPVIETPLSAAASVQEMLLQSYNGKIRIFPAIPSSWKNITFQHMRTEGDFLVSAVRKNGETKWIKIKSLAGNPCKIVIDLKGSIQFKSLQHIAVRDHGHGCYTLDLKKGQSVFIYSQRSPYQSRH